MWQPDLIIFWGGGGGGGGMVMRYFFLFVCSLQFAFYPAALKGSGVLSYPERAGGRADGRAGGRQGRQAPLTLSRP